MTLLSTNIIIPHPTPKPAEKDTKAAPELAPATKITHVFCTRGASEREDIGAARAGDIVTIAGVEGAFVADSVAAPAVDDAVDTVALTPPTVAMSFGSNSGPLYGKSSADFVNSNQIKDRLRSEVMNNVTVSIRNSAESAEGMDVLGKGELQLGILVESMRREGYEMCLSPPQVLLKRAGDEEVGQLVSRGVGEQERERERERERRERQRERERDRERQREKTNAKKRHKQAANSCALLSCPQRLPSSA